MLGVDSQPAALTTILKANLLANTRDAALPYLRGLHPALTGALACRHDPRHQPSTMLIGFSARFFKGPLTRGRDSMKHAIRFDIDMPVPPCLRQVHARGDHYFPAVGNENSIRENESDLLLILESDCAETLDAQERALGELGKQHAVAIVGRSRGAHRPDGVGHLGFKGGISNLQDIRATDMPRYRRYVYVDNGAAGSPAYDGGTYLVYRKYRKHVERWFSDSFTVEDAHGRAYTRDAARARVIGRAPLDNRVIDQETGEPLAREFDCAEAARAPSMSHIRQANPRGVATSAFGDPVVPRDVRILRRSCPYEERDPASGGMIRGLLFVCFQSDIQERGFEFINNQWLHATGFLGRCDPLLDPAAGIIEPVDGCYYFVPPAHAFPGDVFFGTH
jgi:Dyp-type peroxidase family